MTLREHACMHTPPSNQLFFHTASWRERSTLDVSFRALSQQSMPTKDTAARLAEMLEAYRQLRELRLDIDHEDIQAFKRVANVFIRGGAACAQGRIKLRGMQRVLCYKLSTDANVPSQVVLKYRQDV